jgi:hypothetical protein
VLPMGDMEPWMDENFIKHMVEALPGENVQVKVICDRNSRWAFFFLP